ncbi:hypothetical protein N7468_004710 [Penicillium chermesinum]|uniref:Uncharacterized protein n=1 Tax=Penicillium chermesinum TaxID=63820 RepID=A0A9W9P8U3_9EURO|nr:uncharacterized protein N7468_004710 [Penicillium chermesinum]KAJ5240091.1 hypothetical protein N7468_004710 [Penicillium chermesinum]
MYDEQVRPGTVTSGWVHRPFLDSPDTLPSGSLWALGACVVGGPRKDKKGDEAESGVHDEAEVPKLL